MHVKTLSYKEEAVWEVYIQVLEQHMLPSRWYYLQGTPCSFQRDNVKPHTASITTAWFHCRRVQVLDWPACCPDLSPTENIKYNKETHDCWAARILWDKNGTTFLSQTSSSWSPQLPDVYRLLLKAEGRLHSGEHGPVPTFLGCVRCVAAMKCTISSYFTWNGKRSHFQSHFLNKILVYEFCRFP